MKIEEKTYQELKNSDHKILFSNPDIYYTNFYYKEHLVKKKKVKFISKVFKFFKQYFVFNKKFYLKKKLKNLDVLFLSHHAYKNKKHINKDFYFGNLPFELKKNNLNVGIALLNKSFENEIKILNFYEESQIPRIILPNRINFIFEIFHISKIIIKFFLLKLFYKQKYSCIAEKLNFSSSLKTLDVERTRYQIKKLIKIYNPKIIFLTFEGHALERKLIEIINNFNLYSVAFYFAVIKEKKNFSFKNFPDKYMPDELILAGDYAKKFFKNVNINKIKIYGSNRFQTSVNFKKIKKTKNILVCPEGVISETKYMYTFAKKCAQIYKDYNFIFRMHPDINIKLMSQYNCNLNYNLKNLIISKKELLDDILISSFLLYRGSSVAITSGINSVKPVYLKRAGEIYSHDPLYEINKNIITAPIDLKRYLNDTNNNDYMNKKFCLRYFFPEKARPYAEYLLKKIKNV